MLFAVKLMWNSFIFVLHAL